MSGPENLPSHAEVIVIGGGVMGASTAATLAPVAKVTVPSHRVRCSHTQ